ncbi:hypothetical protein POM88_052435 [Heracleum sosnowskyi]|uniref:Uncharacterized protein n=1 Tax=Heracleum sosnowskyi TaxID=360622 RepID=A0AAD8GQL6_9APIA|nr:hypothetical protein POM88_052435 [Heracleum sosnowskyi]
MALSWLYGHRKFTLDYSLKVSSRPPMDFSAHQKILWTLDAWASAEAAVTNSPIEAAVSSDYDLPGISLEGLCVSSHIVSGGVDDSCRKIEHQLEEMHQMLWRKFELEKHKLQA